MARLLSSATGLVTSLQLLPPTPEEPWWRAAALLDCEHAEADRAAGYSRCSTGAAGLTRADALTRTAGESVERVAMHGPPDVVASVAELGDAALPYFQPDWSLGGDPGDAEIGWMRATRLVDGAERLVPLGLVNYPFAASHELFDPGPSGAAAGIGRDQALRSALLETVERDALISAWARRQHLGRIDPDAWLDAVDSTYARSLVDALATVQTVTGVEPVLARIPVGVPGVHCVVGGARAQGPAGPVVCLGAKASSDPIHALAGAVVESLQFLSAVPLLANPEAPLVVTSELDRIAALVSPTGVSWLDGWLDAPVDLGPIDGAGAGPGDLSTDDLLAALVADGLDPYVVDLTQRLPEAVRRMGWVVLKVIPVGYQPLRIDERATFGWNQQRLDSLEERTGVPCREPAGSRFAAPHPLP